VKAIRVIGCCAAALLLAAARAGDYADIHSSARFDYYVLALSWSPTFCATHPSDHAECGHRRGFVVHGLWPQYEAGGGPEHCDSAETLDRDLVERVKSAIPDEHLIRHEWLTHGACTGLTPHDYFMSMIKATARLAIPQQFDGETSHTMTSSQIVAAFVKANPSLEAKSLTLRCRGPQLEEVRVCLSRDLHPGPCAPDVRSHCRSGPLSIGAAQPSPPTPLPR
jgi:ribonuclease T2